MRVGGIGSGWEFGGVDDEGMGMGAEHPTNRQRQRRAMHKRFIKSPLIFSITVSY
jgi:hypothetical protein